MNAVEKMDIIQTKLKAKGVSDVKFFIGNSSEKSVSDVTDSAVNVLEFVLEGKYSNMEPIGDSRGKKS